MFQMISNLTGAFANAVMVIVGGILGMIFKKNIPERFSNTVMTGLGLCVAYIGISGTLKGQNTLILVISTVLGILAGELLDLDGKINKLGEAVQNKFSKKSGGTSIAEGFVSASLLFCIGSMTVLGAIESGVGEGFARHTTQLVKGAIDFVTSIVLASQLGVGVAFSSVFVFAFQGLITVIATFAGNFLSPAMIAEMTCAGSLILIGIGTNMIGITKIKTVNFVPSIFIAAAITALAELLGIYAI